MKSHPNKKAHAPRRIKAQPVRAALPPEMLAKQLMQRFELAFMARDVEAVMACLGIVQHALTRILPYTTLAVLGTLTMLIFITHDNFCFHFYRMRDNFL